MHLLWKMYLRAETDRREALEMKIALDTNRYTDAARGHPDVVRVLNAAREIWMPFIVLGELRAGFACGNAGRANEAHLARFLNSPRVRIVFADEGTTRLLIPSPCAALSNFWSNVESTTSLFILQYANKTASP